MPISDWNPSGLIEDANEEAWKYLRRKSLEIEFEAKRLTPVRTGTARRGIAREEHREQMRILIGCHVHYFIYLELGTIHMLPYAPLTRAFMLVMGNAGQYIPGD